MSSNHPLRVNLPITNYKTGTTVLSKFDYTYNALGLITGWKQQTFRGKLK